MQRGKKTQKNLTIAFTNNDLLSFDMKLPIKSELDFILSVIATEIPKKSPICPIVIIQSEPFKVDFLNANIGGILSIKEKYPPIKTREYKIKGRYWDRTITECESFSGLSLSVFKIVIRPNWFAKAKKQRPKFEIINGLIEIKFISRLLEFIIIYLVIFLKNCLFQ